MPSNCLQPSAPATASSQPDIPQAYQALWQDPGYGMCFLAPIDQGTDFRVVSCNQAMADIFSIDAQTAMGQRLGELVGDGTAQRHLPHYARAYQTHQRVTFQVPGGAHASLSKADSPVWGFTAYPLDPADAGPAATGEPLANGSGTADSVALAAQMMVTAVEVSSPPEETPIAGTSAQVLQQVIDTIPAIIFWKDTDSRYLGCNQVCAELRGYGSPADLVGLTDYDLPWSQAEADEFRACDRRIMAADAAELNIVEYVRRANGRESWMRTSKIPLHAPNGDVFGILGVVEDVTESRESELQQQRLLDILEATPDVVGIADAEGHNRYLNQAGQRLFSISAEQSKRLHIRDLTHPDVVEEVFQVALPAAIAQGMWRGESKVRTAQGHDIPVSQVIICHRDEAGAVARFSTIIRDMSDRKTIEMELKQQSEELSHTLSQLQSTQAQIIQSEKMSSLGQMVAGVAHEINNPVNFIHGNLKPAQSYIQELLELIALYQDAYPAPKAEIADALEDMEVDFIAEDLPKLLDSMSVGTQRIREIVLSLRNFSRLDESDVKTVDLHEGINSTLVILNHRLKSACRCPIAVRKCYGDLPLVDCYPGQLNQVLMNILANAIDALEADKTATAQPAITLTTETDDANALAIVRIADNGPGIPSDIQSHILDPFFTTKPVGKGTGMGMSISYKIITERHGGQLSFTSEEGQGTEFVVAIPLNQPEAT